MAIEGVDQITKALATLEGKPEPARPCYRVRNSIYPRALVLEEGKKTDVMLRLTKQGVWYEFEVTSLTGDVWNENCRGLVRIEEAMPTSKSPFSFCALPIDHFSFRADALSAAPEGVLAPLRHPTPGRLWYKAVEDAGYGFGPLFQKHLQAECVSGQRSSRSTVDLTERPSEYPQSAYPMHPACIDGCLQTCTPALWKGNRSSLDAVLVCPPGSASATGMALASAEYVGVGRREETKNYMTNSTVYDPETGALLFQMSGLRFHKLDTDGGPRAAHKFTWLQWKPDVTFLSQEGLSLVQRHDTYGADLGFATVNEVLDLFVHKKPNLRVAEISLLPSGDTTSIWLDGRSGSTRDGIGGFLFASSDPKTLVMAQERYSAHAVADYQLFEPTKPSGALDVTGPDLDVVILRVVAASLESRAAIEAVRSVLTPGGHVVLFEHRDEAASGGAKVSALLDTRDDFKDSRIIWCEGSQALTHALFATAESKPASSSPMAQRLTSCTSASRRSYTRALSKRSRSLLHQPRASQRRRQQGRRRGVARSRLREYAAARARGDDQTEGGTRWHYRSPSLLRGRGAASGRQQGRGGDRGCGHELQRSGHHHGHRARQRAPARPGGCWHHQACQFHLVQGRRPRAGVREPWRACTWSRCTACKTSQTRSPASACSSTLRQAVWGSRAFSSASISVPRLTSLPAARQSASFWKKSSVSRRRISSIPEPLSSLRS